MTIGLFLASLLASIGLSLPIAFALLVSAVVLMLHLGLFDSQILAQNLINGADSYTLLAIPFFLVAGEVMSRGGLSKRIVLLAMSLVGHRKGGLGFVAIFAAIVMASLSGSAVADTAALGSMLLPMMRQAGYPQGRSAGLMAAGGIIAPIIPPSIPLIIIGVAGSISISKLFLAGIVPGLIMGATLVLMWMFITRKETLVVAEKASGAERLAALRQSFWAILLPVIIIGGIKTGIFTPTEAGVVAAVYAMLVSTLIYRELNLAELYEVLTQAARNTAVVMFLVAAASVASWLISIAQLPMMVAGLLAPLADHPRLLMLAIMAIVLIVGMVMDLTPTILVLTPILMPIVKIAGIDPVYFGIMFVLNCAIGLITPPVGNVLNVITSVGRIKFEKAVMGVLPFVTAYVVLLLLFVAFPQIITMPLYWLAS
ncbi:TRAP transporter large permease subunit [Salinicola lusitanus]|uniref:TRAP transporter large permease subunit n=1 Tax=Salinicola lusitanus TaxID=1949085 RepID=UPI000DA211B7|nr:TRAP transporter large permease subunit [Salinicola lusitanus]